MYDDNLYFVFDVEGEIFDDSPLTTYKRSFYFVQINISAAGTYEIISHVELDPTMGKYWFGDKLAIKLDSSEWTNLIYHRNDVSNIILPFLARSLVSAMGF